LRLAGKAADVRGEKVFNSERRRETKAREDRGGEGIDLQEGTAIANAEDPEKPVDEARPGILHRFAATDLMDGRVEQILLPRNACAYPPGRSWRSITSVFLPAFARRAAAERPPMPLPTTMTSYASCRDSLRMLMSSRAQAMTRFALVVVPLLI
jgi:hypothetical protein